MPATEYVLIHAGYSLHPVTETGNSCTQEAFCSGESAERIHLQQLCPKELEAMLSGAPVASCHSQPGGMASLDSSVGRGKSVQNSVFKTFPSLSIPYLSYSSRF